MASRKGDPTGSGSSTNPHSEGYLEARLAEHKGSSTNPVPEEELEARQAAFAAGESVASIQEAALPSIHNLSLDDVSDDTRVVVLSRSDSQGSSRDTAVAPFRFPNTCRDVLVVQQNSQIADFELSFGDNVFKFVYDVATDNLVIANLNRQKFLLEPIITDEASGISSNVLEALEAVVIQPGPWKIVSPIEGVLTEFLLLHRRYVAQKRVSKPASTGSKRSAPSEATAAGPSKRLNDGSPHKHQDDDGQNIIVFNNPSEVCIPIFMRSCSEPLP